MIYHDGYIYRQDSRNKNEGAKSKSKYWRCKEKSCRARGKTDEKDNLIIIQSKHSHPPDKTEETSEELKERVSLIINLVQQKLFGKSNTSAKREEKKNFELYSLFYPFSVEK